LYFAWYSQYPPSAVGKSPYSSFTLQEKEKQITPFLCKQNHAGLVLASEAPLKSRVHQFINCQFMLEFLQRGLAIWAKVRACSLFNVDCIFTMVFLSYN